VVTTEVGETAAAGVAVFDQAGELAGWVAHVVETEVFVDIFLLAVGGIP
jgi:hypothetical protein